MYNYYFMHGEAWGTDIIMYGELTVICMGDCYNNTYGTIIIIIMRYYYAWGTCV